MAFGMPHGWCRWYNPKRMPFATQPRRPHAASSPFGCRLPHIQLEITQRSLRHDIVQPQFFNGQATDAKVPFGIDAPHEFARRRRWSGIPRKRMEQPLKPAWACARAHPTIQLGGIQVVHDEIEFPAPRGIVVRFVVLFDASLPIAPKPFHSQQTHRVLSIVPI